MNRGRPRPKLRPVSENDSATTLELFFDLVFVFALTQVTAFMAHDLSGTGMLRGILMLGLLWWSWVGYAWLGNVVRADEGPVRLLVLAAMLPMFVLALTIPEAFVDGEGGLPGPVVIAVCYFLFRLMHLLMFWVIARDDPVLRHQLIRFTPSVLGGTLLLLVASQLDGGMQTLFWALALLADYGGTFLGGARGWRLRSAGHFAERHGLILIVALGESIVAIGVGVGELHISWPIVVAAVVGLCLVMSLWWAYFDISALQGEHALAAEPEETRPRLARDAYSFLHFPIVGSVVLIALGIEQALKYVADVENHDLSDPVSEIGLYALYGGVVVYLLGHVAFKWCALHQLHTDRVVVAALLLVLIPVAAQVPALAALAIVAFLMMGMIGFETVVYAEHRERIRHGLSRSDHAGE
ncbi:MAG: low temperature requirement protein A [Propionibacteriales bacterium]|nr:low temperature requirement protein A [Propionibacteriales bacterium]